MTALAVVLVDDGDGDYIVINESDFDPAVHTLFGQAETEPEKAEEADVDDPAEADDPAKEADVEPEPEEAAYDWPTTARALRDHISDAPAEELDAIEKAEGERDGGPRKTVTAALASARRDLGLSDEG